MHVLVHAQWNGEHKSHTPTHTHKEQGTAKTVQVINDQEVVDILKTELLKSHLNALEPCMVLGLCAWQPCCVPLAIGVGAHVGGCVKGPQAAAGAHQEVGQALCHTRGCVAFPLLQLVAAKVEQREPRLSQVMSNRVWHFSATFELC